VLRPFAVVAVLVSWTTASLAQEKPVPSAKSRTFVFTYEGAVTQIPIGKTARIWLPVPPNTAEQNAAIEKTKLPTAFEMTKDRLYGNGLLFFEAKANDQGEIPFHIDYRIKRREVTSGGQANLTRKPDEPRDLIARYLQPDAKVPIAGKPLDLIKEKKISSDPFEAAKTLYDVVNGHMKYSKEGVGWGEGDAVWACDSKFGNCTDFHSLFISMARGRKIPSKFEIGFSIPTNRGEGLIAGYHCWAWFLPSSKGWVPVDISEANRHPAMAEYYFGNLTADRVHFSTGRDITLEPRQAGPPLNFFIYPYVEVDGQPLAPDKVRRSFAYRDAPSPYNGKVP
jgi:transglutaminase-like putative cysteine protease